MRGGFAACGVVLLLGGCGSKDPRLYTLQGREGVVRAAGGVVAVRDVGVPRYLERDGIVHREGERLIVAENDWWGETVAAMVRRVLAADLAQRLPGANVLTADGLGGARAEVEVELNLQRFEGDAGAVVLEGAVAVSGAGRARTLDRLAVRVPERDGSAGGEVEAMSTALGQVADLVAARIGR